MDQTKKLQLEQMSQESSNQRYTFPQINELYNNIFTICPKGMYYPYNHQIKDSGWGCAWRAIQTLLSTQDIEMRFEDLYNKFSRKEDLMDIIKSTKKHNNEVLEQLDSTQWAPADISCHWAEPFIASLASHYYHIPHSLLLLNGQVQSYAPPTVFQAIISFPKFHQLIKKVIKHSSIMIDDGKYALSIIGLNQSIEDKVEILFADPHIRSNKEHKQVGVYRKTFNLAGQGVINQQTESQQIQSLYSVYEKLEFEDKCWMICIIQT